MDALYAAAHRARPDPRRRGRTRDGQLFRARARIVVGADGIRSTIAERAGAPFERIGTSAAAVTYGYWSGLQTDGYEWNFRPGAASGVIPTSNGQACVFASYQMTRDALSTALFDLTGVIAGHRRTDEEIPGLLLQLNAAMAGEVRELAALPRFLPAGSTPAWARN